MLDEPQKILIAEPDIALSNIYKEKLSSLGYEVISVYDGEEVINKAEMMQPDLILINAVLPKKNCYQILEDLKNKDSTKKIPIFITSDNADEEDIRKALKMGASLFFSKDKARLIDVVKNVEEVLRIMRQQ